MRFKEFLLSRNKIHFPDPNPLTGRSNKRGNSFTVVAYGYGEGNAYPSTALRTGMRSLQ